MSDFNLGTVTAYGYAKDKGYTGTEDEFAALMASYADVAEQAAESATQAAASATTASTKASEAAASATAAASSKTAAETAQGGAETAAQTATTKAGEATTAATTATNKATEATTAATTATGKATEAAGSATTATTKAGEASTSATNAAASATRAQEILDSIPEDYSQLSDDVSDLKDGLSLSSHDYDYDESPLSDGFKKAIDFGDWEIGYIYTNGNNLERTYAIRNANKHSLSNPITVIRHNVSYRWFWTAYNSDGTFSSQSSNISNTKYTFTPDSTKKYRFCISLQDTSQTADLVEAILAYSIYDSTDKYIPTDYYLLDRVTFNGANVPQFIQYSSVATKITFPAGIIMYAMSANGYHEEISYTFSSETSFLCDNSGILVWDIESNTVKKLSSNDKLTRYIVLANASYGNMKYGALLPYYLQQQKAQITYNYPPYYDDNNYLSNKINTIREYGQNKGINGDSFIFVTDTHWLKNRKKSPSLVRAIINQTQLNKVIHGGDIPYAFETETGMYDAVRGDTEAWRYACGDYLYRVIGNHDIHATDDTDSNNPVYYELTAPEVYGLLMSEQENRVTYNADRRDGMYYYFDNTLQKIRYVCLNNFETPANAYMTSYQVSWVADRILELTSGWSVVFIGHCSIIQSQNTAYANYADIRGVISAVANKRSFTASYGRTFNFTNSGVTVVGYFAGHEHIDDIDTYDGVTYVLTTCDALLQDDGYNRTMNTINEQAFDVIIIDTGEKEVNLVRIGAGSDRSFEYS